MIDRPDWTADQPAETPAVEPEKPTFTLADLQDFAPEAEDDAGGHEPYDDETEAHVRHLLSRGIMTEEEARLHYGLSDAEIAALSASAERAPGLSSVEAELRDIAQRRKDDLAGYRKDEKAQARERELLEARDRLKAERSTAAPASGELEAIDQELGEIARRRRDDFQGYRKDAQMQQRELELLTRKEQVGRGDGEDLLGDIRASWDRAGGAEHHLGIAQGRVQAALGDLRSGEAEALTGSFDALPIDVQDPITEHLGVEPVRRTADAATMAAIAEAGHGDGLTAQEVGTAQSVAQTMLRGMSPEARADAERWAASLSDSQKRAIILGLAGGRRR